MCRGGGGGGLHVRLVYKFVDVRKLVSGKSCLSCYC